jgi:hypothetical protein
VFAAPIYVIMLNSLHPFQCSCIKIPIPSEPNTRLCSCDQYVERIISSVSCTYDTLIVATVFVVVYGSQPAVLEAVGRWLPFRRPSNDEIYVQVVEDGKY